MFTQSTRDRAVRIKEKDRFSSRSIVQFDFSVPRGLGKNKLILTGNLVLQNVLPLLPRLLSDALPLILSRLDSRSFKTIDS